MNLNVIPCLKNFELDENNVCNLCSKRIIMESALKEINTSCEEEICVSTTVDNLSSSYFSDPIKIIRLAILFVFGSSLFSFSGTAQDTIQTIQTDHQQTSEFQIRGTLLDKNTNEPLPFVNIILEGTKLGCTSDFEGNFALRLQPSQVTFPIKLQFKYVAYNDLELTIDRVIKPGEIEYLGEIYLEEDYNKVIVGIVIETHPRIDPDPNAHRGTTFKREEVEKSPYRD